MLEPGSPVEFYLDGWRTGVFLSIVEHTRSGNDNFGLYRIKPNFLDTKVVLVRPEGVKMLEKKGVKVGIDDLLK